MNGSRKILRPGSVPVPACVEREAAANAAEAQGIRAVNLRIGLVLGRDGGIFPRLALPARLGWRAKIGDGTQWMSWIHIVGPAAHRRDSPSTSRVCAARSTRLRQAPERQGEFQRALARSLRRPFFLRIPAWRCAWRSARWRELLVEGQRVAPRRLLNAGFEFRHFTLASALRDLVPDRVGAPALRARGSQLRSLVQR